MVLESHSGFSLLGNINTNGKYISGDGDSEGISIDATGKVTMSGDVTATSFTIGANTLNTSEWAYLDGQNQAVKTTSSPTFVNLDLTGNLDTNDYIRGTFNTNAQVLSYVYNQNAGASARADWGVYNNSGVGANVSAFSSAHALANQAWFYANGASTALILGTVGAERMRITTTGDVGIGTTSPAATLDVREAGSNAGIRVGYNSTNSVRMDMLAQATQTYIICYNDNTAAYVPLEIRGNDIILENTTNEKLRITSSGITITGDTTANGTITASGLATFNGSMTLQNGDNFTRGVFIVSKDITYNSSSPQTIYTASDGEAVTDVYILVTTAWNGTTGNVDIGDATDNDGFLDCGNLFQPITLSSTGYKGTMLTERGQYLYDGSNLMKRKIYSASTALNAYITTGDATQGAATIYIVIQKLK